MKKHLDKDFEKAVFLREREIELKEEIERTRPRPPIAATRPRKSPGPRLDISSGPIRSPPWRWRGENLPPWRMRCSAIGGQDAAIIGVPSDRRSSSA